MQTFLKKLTVYMDKSNLVSGFKKYLNITNRVLNSSRHARGKFYNLRPDRLRLKLCK